MLFAIMLEVIIITCIGDMKPGGSTIPRGKLANEIDKNLGNFENLQNKFLMLLYLNLEVVGLGY